MDKCATINVHEVCTAHHGSMAPCDSLCTVHTLQAKTVYTMTIYLGMIRMV